MADPRDRSPKRPGVYTGRRTKPGQGLPTITKAHPKMPKGTSADRGTDHAVQQRGSKRG